MEEGPTPLRKECHPAGAGVFDWDTVKLVLKSLGENLQSGFSCCYGKALLPPR